MDGAWCTGPVVCLTKRILCTVGFFMSLNENNLKRNIFYRQKRGFKIFTSSYCNVATQVKNWNKIKLDMN